MIGNEITTKRKHYIVNTIVYLIDVTQTESQHNTDSQSTR